MCVAYLQIVFGREYGLSEVLEVLNWHTLELCEKQKSQEKTVAPWRSCLAAGASHCWPCTSTLPLLPTLTQLFWRERWSWHWGGNAQPTDLQERSSCISLHCPSPPVLSGNRMPTHHHMAGAGPSTPCPPALATATLGQGEDVILEWSCMCDGGQGLNTHLLTQQPRSCLLIQPWLLPPTFSLFYSGCVELGGTRVQWGLKLCIAWHFCLGRTSSRDTMEGWAGDRLGALAQLNPALHLPGSPAAYMGSTLLRTGDCTHGMEGKSQSLESARSKEAHDDSAQLHRLLFLTLYRMQLQL